MSDEHRYKLPEPLARPDVPDWAERIDIKPHVRLQFQPTLLNALGNPDIHGPRDYVGIECRCPICKKIFQLGPPGVEQVCPGCDLRLLYTAAKANTWLYLWRPREKLDLDGPAGSPQGKLLEIPVGSSVEVERAYPPGYKRDSTKEAASARSGFTVNVGAKKKDGNSN